MKSECTISELVTGDTEKVIKTMFSTWKYEFSIWGKYDTQGKLVFDYNIEKY